MLIKLSKETKYVICIFRTGKLPNPDKYTDVCDLGSATNRLITSVKLLDFKTESLELFTLTAKEIRNPALKKTL